MEDRDLQNVVVGKDKDTEVDQEDEIAIIDQELQDGVADEEFDILDMDDVSEKKMIQYIFKIVKDGKTERLSKLQENYGEKKMKKWLTSRDEKFNTPLHYASMNTDLPMMEWLLTNIKLKVEEKGQHQMVALHFAARYGKPPKPMRPKEEVSVVRVDICQVKYYREKRIRRLGPLWSICCRGAVTGEAESVNHSRLQSSVRNVKDKYGFTVLHHAVYRENIPLVNKLLELKGLRPEERDEQGNNALHLAAQGKNVSLVKRLMSPRHMEMILERNREGQTPLHIAAGTGSKQVIKALLESEEGKKTLETEDCRHQTPLLIASSVGNKEVMELLINHGASVRKRWDNISS